LELIDSDGQALTEPTWAYFRASNLDPESTFEQIVAKRLFCAAIDVLPKAMSCPDGFPGIECHPISTAQGWVGYQAKYSHDGKQNVALFKCLEHAFKRKAKGEYSLDIVFCYSSGVPPRGKIAAQKEIEELAKKYQVHLEWRFADQIIEELRDTTNPIVQRARREFFEDLLQPALRQPAPVSGAAGASEYHFAQKTTPYVGRESNLLALHSFLESNEPVAWWGVTGKGGSGKSRLLLEFGSHLESDWHWGWLTDEEIASFDFAKWRPTKHTLLIVDYAIGREQSMAKLFSALRDVAEHHQSLHRIRLVVLEREAGQWFKGLKTMNLIGPWVESVLHDGDLLIIESLSSQKLLTLATEIATLQPAGSVDPGHLVEKAQLLGIERAPLLMQLIASFADIASVDRIELIRAFIDRDKQRRWSTATITDADLDMLSIGTLCGGVDLTKASYANEEAHDYFAAFTNFEHLAIMIGEAVTVGNVGALEPDLLGELFVLDRLVSFNPLSGDSQRLFDTAASINNGRGIVSFFSRCRDDYPSHPAFNLLNGVWASNPANPTVWTLIVSNVIDVDAISVEVKLTSYRSILSKWKPTAEFPSLIEQVLFVRLLSSLVKNGRSRQYIGQLDIAEEVIVPQVPTSTSFLEQLYPEQYCDDILRDYRQLSANERETLSGPHIITIFHHKILHSLNNRDVELTDCFELYTELATILKSNLPTNYMVSIAAIHHLAANFIAGLIQFNRHRPDAKLAVSCAESVRSDARQLSASEYNGQPVVMKTTTLERVDMGFSVLLSHTHVRSYQYLLELVRDLERQSPGPASSSSSATIFVSTCVQIAHGFESAQQYTEFLEIYQRCMDYAERYPSVGMAQSLGMIHTQLARSYLPYMNDDARQKSLDHAIDLARQFPSEEAGVLKYVLQTISTEYNNAIVQDDFEKATALHKEALDLVEELPCQAYSNQGRIWCGDLVLKSLYAHVETNEPLAPAIRALQIFSAASYIALTDSLNTSNVTSELFSKGQLATNSSDPDKLKRCIDCIRLIGQHQNYSAPGQLLEILQANLETISNVDRPV